MYRKHRLFSLSISAPSPLSPSPSLSYNVRLLLANWLLSAMHLSSKRGFGPSVSFSLSQLSLSSCLRNMHVGCATNRHGPSLLSWVLSNPPLPSKQKGVCLIAMSWSRYLHLRAQTMTCVRVCVSVCVCVCVSVCVYV